MLNDYINNQIVLQQLLDLKESKQMTWEDVAKALHQILEGADISEDVCKEDIQRFQHLVMKLQSKKNQYLSKTQERKLPECACHVDGLSNGQLAQYYQRMDASYKASGALDNLEEDKKQTDAEMLLRKLHAGQYKRGGFILPSGKVAEIDDYQMGDHDWYAGEHILGNEDGKLSGSDIYYAFLEDGNIRWLINEPRSEFDIELAVKPDQGQLTAIRKLMKGYDNFIWDYVPQSGPAHGTKRGEDYKSFMTHMRSLEESVDEASFGSKIRKAGTTAVLGAASLVGGFPQTSPVDLDSPEYTQSEPDEAYDKVNLKQLAQVESGGDPNAESPTGARGIYQITQATWAELTDMMGKDWEWEDAYDPEKNTAVADYYANVEVPRLLNYYKIDDTVDNRLAGYTLGIGKLRANGPDEAADYIAKYHAAKESTSEARGNWRNWESLKCPKCRWCDYKKNFAKRGEKIPEDCPECGTKLVLEESKKNEAHDSSLPDWILLGIERYLQAASAGEIEGEVYADDVLDFISSTNIEQDFTDELQAAAKTEIEGYLPLGKPEEDEFTHRSTEEDDDEFDRWEDEYDDSKAAPKVDRKRQYPDAKDIDIVQHGINTYILVDKTSGEVLSKPMSKVDAEQKLHHIASKNEAFETEDSVLAVKVEFDKNGYEIFGLKNLEHSKGSIWWLLQKVPITKDEPIQQIERYAENAGREAATVHRVRFTGTYIKGEPVDEADDKEVKSYRVWYKDPSQAELVKMKHDFRAFTSQDAELAARKLLDKEAPGNEFEIAKSELVEAVATKNTQKELVNAVGTVNVGGLKNSDYPGVESSWKKFWLLTNGKLVPVEYSHQGTANQIEGHTYTGFDEELYTEGAYSGYVSDSGEMGLRTKFSKKKLTRQQRATARQLYIHYGVETVYLEDRYGVEGGSVDSAKRLDYLLTYGTLDESKINEATPLYCLNCGEDLGKDTENWNPASCGTCGKTGIKNPRGQSKSQQSNYDSSLPSTHEMIRFIKDFLNNKATWGQVRRIHAIQYFDFPEKTDPKYKGAYVKKLIDNLVELTRNDITRIYKRIKNNDVEESKSFISIKKLQEGVVDHAKHELETAGLFDKDSDYDGMLGEAVMELMELFADQGHSGFSAGMCAELFNKLSQYQPLTELTDNPEEWQAVSEWYGGPEEDLVGMEFQSKRNPTCFSSNGGKTYYNLDEMHKDELDENGEVIGYSIDHNKKEMHTSAPYKVKSEDRRDK